MRCGPKGSQRASCLRDTQEGARTFRQKLNPDDHAGIERVRNTKGGVRTNGALLSRAERVQGATIAISVACEAEFMPPGIELRRIAIYPVRPGFRQFSPAYSSRQHADALHA